jgi:hypothetical protein
VAVKTPPRSHLREPDPIDVLREPMAPIGHDEPLLPGRGRVLGLIALLAVLVAIVVIGVNLRGPTTTLSWEGDWKDLVVSAPTSTPELADWKDLVGSPTAPDTGDWKDTIG